jgi:hypothetical protein
MCSTLHAWAAAGRAFTSAAGWRVNLRITTLNRTTNLLWSIITEFYGHLTTLSLLRCLKKGNGSSMESKSIFAVACSTLEWTIRIAEYGAPITHK